jgi:hypothetical protein
VFALQAAHLAEEIIAQLAPGEVPPTLVRSLIAVV